MADAEPARARVYRVLFRYTLIAMISGVGASAAVGAAEAGSRAPAPIVFKAANPNAPAARSGPVQLAHITAPGKSFGRDAAKPAQRVSVPRARKTDQHVKSSKARSAAASETPPPGYAKQKIGAPYQIAGKWYVPTAEPDYDEVGVASWYGPKFHGRDTANGEVFDMNAMTAAHPTLPIPSLVRVTNVENGRSAVLRLNDRGPFADDRIIDLSRQAARTLDFETAGTAKVRVEYLGFAPETPNSTGSSAATHAVMRATPVSRPLDSPAPNPNAPPAEPKGVHYLQAGAFTDIGNAHKMRIAVKPFGPASIKEARVNGSDYFRVMVGPWATERDADAVKRRLVGAGYSVILVSRSR